MSSRRKRELKEKAIVAIQTALVYGALVAVFVLVAMQWLVIDLLNKVIEADEASSTATTTEQVEFVPATDPCGLFFVDCAEAHTEPKVESTNPDAEALRAYLISKGGHEMAEHAEEILELYRWQDVVAIAWKETNFCTAGVGASRNNCGGIKSWRTDRTFKHYDTVYDSLWDIAYLLQKPRFKGDTIDELNGVYCVDEANGGGKCPNWTEVVTKVRNEVASIVQ